MPTSVFLSSQSPEWYTPSSIVERARVVLDRKIDLDPASSNEANKTVKAENYITQHTKGIVWEDYYRNGKPINIFLNPPSGKVGNCSLPMIFWSDLMRFRDRGMLNQAIVIAFNLNQLAITQNDNDIPSMLSFPTCIPSKRLKYTQPGKNKVSNPPHNSAIIYVPGVTDSTEAFKRNFEDLGIIAQAI